MINEEEEINQDQNIGSFTYFHTFLFCGNRSYHKLIIVTVLSIEVNRNLIDRSYCVLLLLTKLVRIYKKLLYIN